MHQNSNQYKINVQTNDNKDQQSYLIRKRSSQCLQHVLLYGDESVYADLQNIGFVGTSIIPISSAGSFGENDEDQMFMGLIDVSSLFISLHNVSDNPHYPTFPPQPTLLKTSQEQVEEEGAYEEVESLLIDNGRRNCIKKRAKQTKREILNIWIDMNNPKPDFYD
ncbi:MAG: hypothetical protein EZS28_011865 [Streblomastix strix]|uniref:Uncharacterized protein n=1 Tax=Streblomastix strix TaxID=222440 RepID=A0A5J4WCD5_9EUKA|nr:MAG: hypothetical protein EZS28_011865 [Streblomastix strix]